MILQLIVVKQDWNVTILNIINILIFSQQICVVAYSQSSSIVYKYTFLTDSRLFIIPHYYGC
jgi:hypothetical protein